MYELKKPALERADIELENILRWEDEGGLVTNAVIESSVILSSNHLPLGQDLYPVHTGWEKCVLTFKSETLNEFFYLTEGHFA
jgi:hypothetical protein